MSAGPAETGIGTIVVPRTRDLGGGFEVRRVLPAIERRMVGPFVFFDQMGPTVFRPGDGLDVRPHPHIGLATITYLFEGEILHRDSLGTVQPIRPGEVNWMVAGRGIAHSERTAPEHRNGGQALFGIQAWIGLPQRDEETEPAFSYHDRGDLPVIDRGGAQIRLIAGTLFGARSPVPIFSEMFYADAILTGGARLTLPTEHEERAIYIAEGAVEVGSEQYVEGRLLAFQPGVDVMIRARGPARLMLLGGTPLDGPRHIWWNFVSSSRERIERAKADWKAARFAPVPGETEFIPLPGESPPVQPL